MSNPISTRCPKCKAILKLKNSAAIGKKVPCPKCQNPFVVKPISRKPKPAPAAEDEFLDGLEDFDDDDYGKEALPALPSRNRSSKRPSKKKAQPAGRKNPAVIIGGSVVGALLLVGGILFASGVFSADEAEEGDPTEIAEADGKDANKGKKRGKRGGEKKGATKAAQRSGKQVNLAWLPDDTELVVSIRVADLWNTPLIQSLIQDPEAEQGIALFRESIGLEPGDLESITLGFTKIAETAKAVQSVFSVQGVLPGPAPDLDAVSAALIFRTTKPVDTEKILALIRQSDENIDAEIQKTQHNGKEYYRFPNQNPQNPQMLGLFAADENTIVLGIERSVKTAIEGNGRAGDASRFKFADAGQHFMLAFVPSDSAAFVEKMTASPFEDPTPAQKKLSAALKGKLRGVAFGLTLNEELSVQFDTNMQDAQAAKKVSAALGDIIQEGLDGLAEAESSVPANLKKYITLATEVLKAANTATKNKVAQIDIKLSLLSLMTLKSLPEDVMASMFSGGGGNAGFGPTGVNSGTVRTIVSPSAVPMVKKQPAKPIKAVDLEGFDKSWQTDINLTNQSAGDALKKLAGEMGLTPDSDRRQNASLSKMVTVKLKKKSRLEAIEEICKQIGVHPIYESKTEFSMGEWVNKEMIRFEPGPRPYPVQFVGPFLIAVTQIQDKAPNPTGRVSLQIVATNLPESVVNRFRNNHMGPATVAAVLGPKEQSLRDVETGQIISGFGEKKGTGNFIQTVAIPLKDLLRDVTAIKTISGQVKFDIPTEIKTMKLDKLTQGAVKKDGALTLTLKTIQLDDENSSINFELTGLGERFDSKNIVVELRNSNDQLLEVFGSGGFGFGGKKSYNYQVEGEPASVTLKIVTQTADMQRDFAFNEIALKSFAKMPVKIVPAKFPGHDSPVSLEFVKTTGKENFRKVQFKLVNHSDKGIAKIDMTLVYLDAAGKKLKDFPSGYSSPTQFGPNGQQTQEPAVKKNATKQIEITAFFMPEETKTVKAELRKVRFVDAETWKADRRN